MASEETAQHRADRLAYCDSMGMIRPASLYEMGSSCYACHAISDTELLEVAGHPAGDAFEFASWSQGGIRHNFVRQGADANPRSAPGRVRVMYLVGAALRLEHACRAVEQGATVDRVRDAVAQLERIDAVVELDAVTRLIGIGAGVVDGPSAKAAVAEVAAIGRLIAENGTGSAEAGIDALIPEPVAGVVE